ncbi:MAG: glycosyltransferase family 4 protein [Candidatus Methylomirabilia bacterium]
MRIGIDARLAAAPRTGIGSYTGRLVDALEKIGGPDQFVLFTDEPLHRPAHQRFANAVLPVKQRYLWTFGALPGACRARRLDLFHGTSNFELPIAAGCPLVATVHDLIPLRCPGAVSRQYRLLFGVLIGRALRAARRVMTDAEFTRREILGSFPIAPDKVVTVPLAAGPAFTPDPDPEGRRRVCARHGLVGRYLLFVSVFEPRKNIPLLVDAFEIFRREYPHGSAFQLALAGGPGWRGEEIAESVHRRGLEPAVRLLGYVPEEDLPWLYRGAELAVVPSQYEGFGLSALEAMACGTPVLAADASSLPEVVGAGGELFAPGDAALLARRIAEITAAPERRALMREHGLARAAGFSWDRTARRVLEVYREAARA